MGLEPTRFPALRLLRYTEPANGDLVGITVAGREAAVGPGGKNP